MDNLSSDTPFFGEGIWLEHMRRYSAWLSEQALSPHTKRAYCSQVRKFILFLIDSNRGDDRDLEDAHRFTQVVNDYRAFSKDVVRLGPSSINNSMIALDNFCAFLGIQNARTDRERRPRSVPRTLRSGEQRIFLSWLDQQESTRDQALALLLLSTGLRVSECAQLQVENVVMTEGLSKLLLMRKPFNSTGSHRLLTLDSSTGEALRAWLNERARICTGDSALWINRRGQPLSVAGVQFIIRRMGIFTQLKISPEVLRQTALANLMNNTMDMTPADSAGQFNQHDVVTPFAMRLDTDSQLH